MTAYTTTAITATLAAGAGASLPDGDLHPLPTAQLQHQQRPGWACGLLHQTGVPKSTSPVRSGATVCHFNIIIAQGADALAVIAT